MMGDSQDNRTRMFRAGDGAKAHWERVKQRVDAGAAAVVFFTTLIAFFTFIHVNSEAARQLYHDVSREVNFCDMTELNEYGDYLLLDYLAGSGNAQTTEAVVLGASYTANGYDPDPAGRMHRNLERRMEQATGGDWEITNLATNGYCPWAFFYVTRLLREHRSPDVLILGLDVVYINKRSSHLVLNAGADPGEASFTELAGVLPVNSVIPYAVEGNLNHWLRDHLRCYEVFGYLKACYPKRASLKRWLQFMQSRLTGRQVVLSTPANRNPDGTYKSWQEIPTACKLIEGMQSEGNALPQAYPLTPRRKQNLELLGSELRHLQQEGTRVLVFTNPRNPVVPLELGEALAYVEDWAARYGLEFHDYWTSALVPGEYYLDTGHFFGHGQVIIADIIAGSLLEEDRGNGGGQQQPPSEEDGQ